MESQSRKYNKIFSRKLLFFTFLTTFFLANSIETGLEAGKRGSGRCPRSCVCDKGEATCTALKTQHIRKILNKLPRSTQTLIIRDTQFSKLDDPDSVVNIIQPGTFKGKAMAKKLKKVVLDGNSITHISADSFNLPNMKTLILSNNNLRAIEQETFLGMENLRTLSLLNNRLTQIPSHAFKLVQQLRQLDLSMNQLNSIEVNSLTQLQHLRLLQLNDNRITNIEIASFSDLSTLNKLDLDRNNLNNMPDFTGLPQLQILSVQSNQLKTVPANAFNDNSKLKFLDLSTNQVKKIGWAGIADLEKLVTLNVTGNLIQTLPERLGGSLEALHGAKNQFVCDCGMNKFQEWTDKVGKPELSDYIFCAQPSQYEGQALSGLTPDQLQQECTVKENQSNTDPNLTKTIPATSASIIVELSETDTQSSADTLGTNPQTVDIDDLATTMLPLTTTTPAIQEITGLNMRQSQRICPDEGVSRCSCIQYIFQINCAHKDLDVVPTSFSESIKLFDLRHNYVQEINEGAFKGMAKLKSIHLQHNMIRVIGKSDFEGLNELTYLYMNFNRIEYIHADAFRSLGKLAYLYLDNNELTSLAETSLNPLVGLYNLDIQNNKLDKLYQNSFEKMTRLRKVRLNDNKLKTLPDALFKPIPKLKNLDLGNNEITRVHPKVMGDLLNLETLQLNGNPITAILAKDLKKLAKLQNLRLDNCQLVEIEKGSFNHLTNLQYLNLTSNDLRNVPAPLHSTELIQLDMKNNPWKCNCNMLEVYIFLRQNPRITVSEFSCNAPGKLKDRPVLTLTKKEICKHSTTGGKKNKKNKNKHSE